jgi:hypothetical protein
MLGFDPRNLSKYLKYNCLLLFDSVKTAECSEKEGANVSDDVDDYGCAHLRRIQTLLWKWLDLDVTSLFLEIRDPLNDFIPMVYLDIL